MERHAGHVEQEGRAAREPCGDQVLDDLGLAVDGDRAPVRQVAEGDPVTLAVELQLDAVVHEALAAHALTHARGVQQIDGALLQHACAYALLDSLPTARLEHERLDALELEQLRQHESRRPGADDADLRAHQAAGVRSNNAAWPCPAPTQSVASP